MFSLFTEGHHHQHKREKGNSTLAFPGSRILELVYGLVYDSMAHRRFYSHRIGVSGEGEDNELRNRIARLFRLTPDRSRLGQPRRSPLPLFF